MHECSETFRDTPALTVAADVQVTQVGDIASKPLDYAVCIPARNEEQAIGATLDALGAAMADYRGTGCVVLAINDTADRTASIAHGWAQARGIPTLIARFDLPIAERTAPRTRRIAMDLGQRLVPGGTLLTTDADTLVERGWIARNLAELSCGADLVCGQIALDPDELAVLPRRVHRIGAAEAEFFALTEELWHRWTGSAEPLHIRASGASLALRAETYGAVGGLPTPPFAEDKALCTLVRGHGYTAIALDMPDTVSSARLWGRAANGCGHALRQRMQEADPPCDELLLPLGTLARIAARCRKVPVPVAYRGYLAAREALAKDVPRMAYSDVVRELAMHRHHRDEAARAEL